MTKNKVEDKKISDLLPDNQNVNVHTQRGRGIVEHSVRRYGVGRGIVAAGKGTDTPQIIGGHLTTEIVGSLDMDDVIFVHTNGDKLVVTVRDDIEPNSAEAIALGLIDNESQKQSYNPDLDILAAVMADPAMQALRAEDKMLADIVEGMGLKVETADAEPQIDRAAELQVKWQTEAGQLWQLGKHRLLIGDCTVRENVERLMGGERAVLMVTDPPYGVDYGELVRGRENQKKGDWEDIKNDALSDEDLQKLLTSSLHGAGANVGFVFHPAGERRWLFWSAVKENGWTVSQEIVWVKNAMVFGRADYQWRHEPCLYLKKDGARKKQEDRTQTTVWEIDKPHNSIHPTQKPFELFEIPIRNHTESGELVYEPFAGSGTTIIAAQNLSRRCFAMEISPNYCAVILERFATAFPDEEIRLIE
jgi:DNA modification methylase